MGPLLSVIAAIVLHGLGQAGYSLERAPLSVLPLGFALGVGLPYWASARSRRAAERGDLARGRVFLLLAESSGWLGFAALLLLCGWISVVRRLTGASLELDGWPEFALLLSFAPFLLFQCLAIDAAIRAHGGSSVVQRHLRSFQLRMFVASVFPIAIFIAASALLGRSAWLRTEVEHVGVASALFTGVMVVALAQLLPMLLRWSWDTEPFPHGPQRDLLATVEERTGFQPRDVRLWRTGDLMANAAIVGFGRRGRTVLFSDQLLSILNSRELCAVYAHEIGHALRRHVAVFLAWTSGFIFLGEAAARTAFADGDMAAMVLVLALSGLAWFASFGWLSRRFELDADLFSLEAVRDLPALTGALERVGGRNRERSGWRHFSVARRIRFLARAAGDPGFVARFRRRLAWFAAAAATLALVGAGVQLWGLVSDLPEDRAVASLARGDYGRAAEIAEQRGSRTSDELRQLVAAAGTIEGSSVEATSAALDESLAEAARTGDLAVALAVARVATLRGIRPAAGVAEVLQRARDGDGGGAVRALGTLDEVWRPRVAAAIAPR